MNAKSKRISLALLAVSFALCWVVILAVAGIKRTPFDTTDSSDRPMGFNDHLSAQHYSIMLSNFRIHALFDRSYLYSWFLLAMHGCGALLIIRADPWSPRWLRRFFVVQGILFPIGWFGFLTLPFTAYWIATGTLDREGITDVPAIAFTTHPIWIATAMTILFITRKAPASNPYESGEPKIA